MHIIAQTSRLIVRNFKPEEENIYLSIFDDERVTLHLAKRCREEYVTIFKETLDNYSQNKPLGQWAIFNSTDDDLIGFCSLREWPSGEGKVELGYVLHKKYWGKGIGTEIVKEMVKYAFEHTDADAVVATTTRGNTASHRVLKKAGFLPGFNVMRTPEEVGDFFDYDYIFACFSIPRLAYLPS